MGLRSFPPPQWTPTSADPLVVQLSEQRRTRAGNDPGPRRLRARPGNRRPADALQLSYGDRRGARRAFESQISYTASKGAVLSLSRELGVEFADRGVRVNALCPGPVNTPLLKELFAKDPERAAKRLVHIPMGRFGEPDEIAKAALFLASDDSTFVTASTFLVDGGLSAAYLTLIQVDD